MEIVTRGDLTEAINNIGPSLSPREKILRLEEIMKGMPQIELPLKHHWAPDNYGREILLPAGSIVIGKIHKHAHLNVVSYGRCIVYTEFEVMDIEAPLTFVSKPGTKRVVYSLTDVVWTTIHPNPSNTKDLEKIEDYVIAKSYDALLQFQKQELLI